MPRYPDSPTLVAGMPARLQGLVLCLDRLLPERPFAVASSLAGCPLTRFLSLRAAGRMLQFLPALDPRAAPLGGARRAEGVGGTQGVLLAASDRDTVTPVDASLWLAGGAPQIRSLRHRRLDTLFPAGNRPVDVLLIAERAERVANVLEGCEGLLGANSPALLFPYDGSDLNCLLTLQLLYRAGHALLDAGLHVHDPQVLAKHLRSLDPGWMLAVPARVAQATASAGLAALEALARSSRMPGSSALSLDIDEERVGWGFHAPNGAPGKRWAWIGPRPNAGLYLPDTGSRVRRVQLQSLDPVAPRDLDRLVARWDGQSTSVSVSSLASVGVQVELVPKASNAQMAMHLLELSFATTQRVGAADNCSAAWRLDAIVMD